MGLPRFRLPQRLAVIATGSSSWRWRRSTPRSGRRSSQYQISTLPNGLRVILSEDHSTPIVHVSVWYHVGSKNERPAAPASRICSST
jgi:zinc protease